MRKDWTFRIKADIVGEAATKKSAYHRGRALFWKIELESVQDRIKSSGVTMEEQGVTGGVRIVAKIDSTMANRANECGEKMKDHQTKAEEYEAFAMALRLLNSGETVELDVADITYFGL